MILTTIRNEEKRTIPISDGLRLLQMVLELDIEQYTSKDAELPRE